MGRARVIVSDSVVATGGLDQIQHGLELTDVGHVAVDAEKILLCEIAFLKFFLDGLVVLHHRNLRKLKLVILRTQGLVRIDVKRFWHISIFLIVFRDSLRQPGDGHSTDIAKVIISTRTLSP